MKVLNRFARGLGLGFGFACSLSLAACDPGSAAGVDVPAPSSPVTEPVPGSGGATAGPIIDLGAPAMVPLFPGALVQSAHAVPVVGGTLLVLRGGQTIAAADPERDAVFLVDSLARTVRQVRLQPGDEPGRIVEGEGGTLFVALRRGGAVARIDVASASLTSSEPVCASLRGLAFDSKSGSLYVACRGGALVTLDAHDLTRKRSVLLDPDLRDVIVRENELVVTRFLSSELLVVADDGSVSRRATPSPEPGCAEATVAFRAFSVPGGQIALGHQASSNQALGEGPGGYGSSACGGNIVTRFLTLVDPDKATPEPVPVTLDPNLAPSVQDPAGNVAPASMTFQSVALPGAGPLDLAFSPKGDRIAVIAFDEGMGSQNRPVAAGSSPTDSLWLAPWDGKTLPQFVPAAEPLAVLGRRPGGQPVAVAFDAAGKFVVQSREPATLEFEDGTSVSLSDESHTDTGHQLFHMDSGLGVACSSCHPEGGEDGHVWRFAEGLRRTLPLEGGVLERAPFHWDGTLGDMGELVSEVLVKRMGLSALPSTAQVAALGSFLEQLPNLPPREGLDAAAVKRGQAVFEREDVGCATCHKAPQYTDNRLADVGTGGKFVTPTLLGVGLRTALFHDGCAKSLADRFGPCGGTAHGKPELLSADARADLIAFLQSL